MAATDKIRVIIVDDIAETRENIRKLLQFENDVEVIGVARTGREGLDLAKETKPDVVLMDINMPDMDGIQATDAIRRSVPFAQIVILSVQSDPNYMRRAMQAGASDFLAKPPSVDELTAAIRRAGTLARAERAKNAQSFPPPGATPGAGAMAAPVGMGKVIVVYSPKGGTGCTTVATNLAISLNNEETPAVLVDGTLQFGDVAPFLNLTGKNSIVDLAPRADDLEPEIIESVLLKHPRSGVKVLAAPIRPEEAESVTGEQFSKVIRHLCRMFSYVVVDAASALNDVTINAMDVSDAIVLVITQDIPSIMRARQFLDVADALKIERNSILLVLNRFEKWINVMPERISEHFKHEVKAVIPFDDRAVIQSINSGPPLVLGDKSRPVARQMLALTEVVRRRLAESGKREEPLPKKSIIGKK